MKMSERGKWVGEEMGTKRKNNRSKAREDQQGSFSWNGREMEVERT